MGYNTALISVGFGECLYARRDIARPTFQTKAASVNTTTSFTCTTAEIAKIRVGDILASASLVVPLNTVAEATTQPRVISIVAAGADWLATVSPAFGVLPAALEALQILYSDLGATDGDVVLRAALEVEKMFIDQSVDPVAAILKSRELQAILPLAENTVNNFAAALSLAPLAGGLSLNIGATVAAVREDRILLIQPAPNSKKRFIMLNRTVNEGEASLTASKDKKGIINLVLTAMQDTTMGAASLGALLDVTVA